MAKSRKTLKTNAVRLVEQKKIPFTLIEYDISDGLLDGVSVAEKTGQRVESVFKTLVTRANDQRIFVFLLPVAFELDMKKAAHVANVKKIDLLPMQNLMKETGYVRGGCSPIGMKKTYPTFIDRSAEKNTLITVSAGKPGLQMTIPFDDCVHLTKATVTDLQK